MIPALNRQIIYADYTDMFPLSALLSHAELTLRPAPASNAGEARHAARRVRYGNLTLFPRVEPLETIINQEWTADQEPRVIASISNVSSTGIGLILNDALPPGLEFDVDWDEVEFPLPLRFQVVHSRPVSGGMYRTGARLIAGAMPEEPVPTDFVSQEMPPDCEADAIEDAMPDEPAKAQFAGGILKIEPESYGTESRPGTPLPPGTFRAAQALGFNKTEKLDGVTTCGWERSITIRRDGARLWICIHSPDKKNGWGIFVQPDQLEAVLARLQRAAQSPFITSIAA